MQLKNTVKYRWFITITVRGLFERSRGRYGSIDQRYDERRNRRRLRCRELSEGPLRVPLIKRQTILAKGHLVVVREIKEVVDNGVFEPWIECCLSTRAARRCPHGVACLFPFTNLSNQGYLSSHSAVRVRHRSVNNKRSSSSRIRENSLSPLQFGWFVSWDRASCMCNDLHGVPRTALARPFVVTPGIAPWFMHVKLEPSI